MIIFPAIDLLDGRVVRLRQGDYQRVSEFSDDPLEVAQCFEAAGSSYLHVVDLNAARGDRSDNQEWIQKILEQTSLKLQLGGGIRSLARIENWLHRGVWRVVLGTAAIKNPAFLAEAISNWPDAIVLGLDAFRGQLRTGGWLENSDRSLIDFAREASSMGLKYLIYTDIERDGELLGPDLDNCIRLTNELGLNVTASGGVRSLEDIEAAREAGLYAMIIGKALYQDRISLPDALEMSKR